MCSLNVLFITFILVKLCVGQIDPRCDFEQNIAIGQEYYIYNLEYPQNSVYTACRWTAKSPPGTILITSCNVDIPSNPDCQKDKLVFSANGDPNLQNGEVFCGKTEFMAYTYSNSFAMGLFTSPRRSRFVCSVTAMKIQSNCQCGLHFKKKIVGGQETGINEYPFMGALVDASTHEVFCGANLISDRYALSAAHCFLHQKASNLGLLLGDHDVNSGSDTASAALYRVAYFTQHPAYDQSTELNDIAVIKTTTTITLGMAVSPICLPFQYSSYNFAGDTVTALGWGFQDFSGAKSSVLMKVDLKVIPNNQCVVKGPVAPTQMCTYAPGKDSCLSDSGGPLVWKDFYTGRLELVGIISYGIGCATRTPAVNTRVTSYLYWIATVTTDASFCIR